MIRAAIFDMDGLMFGTERIAFDCWKQACAEQGVEYTLALHMQVMGRDGNVTMRHLNRVFGPGFSAERARERRGELKKKYIDRHGVPMQKGLRELLAWLRQQGIKRAVASSSSMEDIRWLTGLHGLTEEFDQLISGEEVKESKPNPEVFLLAAKRLDVPPEEAVVLEDSAAGIQAAHDGGFFSIMVPDMAPATEELRARCTAVAEDLSAVIPILQQWNTKRP